MAVPQTARVMQQAVIPDEKTKQIVERYKDCWMAVTRNSCSNCSGTDLLFAENARS